MPLLFEIDLSGTKLSAVPDWSTLTNLKFLHLDNNLITDVSPFAPLVSLQILELKNNTIGLGVPGKVNLLTSLINANSILLDGNINISCNELSLLISDKNTVTPVVSPTVVTAGTNCRSP